jgi:hypothetical protein
MKKFLLSLLVLMAPVAHAFNVAMPNVMQYGAIGNGTADDTAAIQTAINANQGKALWFPAANYKISSALNIPPNTVLTGDYRLSEAGGSIITQTTANPIFALNNSSNTVAEIQNIAINGFDLVGGSTQIYASNGGVYVSIENVTFGSYTGSAILTRGFNQQWQMRNTEMSGGQYGMYLSSTGVQQDGHTLGTPMLWDKCTYYNFYVHGQTINGIYIVMNSGDADHNTFYDLTETTIVQDGLIFGGGMNGLTIVNLNSEQIGYTGTTSTAATVATTISGSPNVSVASGSGLVNGTTVTIAGAALNGSNLPGADWQPWILSGGGTTNLVMNSNAPVSVSSAELVNYLYSDIKFIGNGNPSGNPNQVTLINPNVGQPNPGVSVDLYGINMGGCQYGCSIINPISGRPIYDPSLITQILVSTNVNASVRPASQLVGTYLSSATTNTSITAPVTFFNCASLPLTAGNWDVSGSIGYTIAFTTPSYSITALSLYPGNTNTDGVPAYSNIYNAVYSSNSVAGVVPRFQVQATTAESVYLKGYIASIPTGTPTMSCAIQARRIY